MHAKGTVEERRPTLTELMRIWFRKSLDPVADFLNRLGLAPNTVTLIGLAGNLVGSLFLARGELTTGGILVLAMGPVDALDGTMARLRGERSDFGAFVDSVTDRYSELLIYAGLIAYYLQRGDSLMAAGVFAAWGGSVLVSYVKARGEALGFDVRGGLLTRLERYLVLAPSLVFGYPSLGILAVAIFANFTAFQRIYLVRRQARRRSEVR
ncbi:MAG TPA: CDP-alcohol phosphatidyltransferase family protein [Anaerolineales bacterium]|nr:CDP-alcohol phosphatidyltransferase family protein [Anaerolineales bacterium]